MTASPSLASLLQRFFTDRLVRQQRASPHTIASYRDAFRLLLRFAQERLGKAPSMLALDDLDAAFVGAFLDHVEQHRRNTPRTRNVRLAAIHAFFRYVAISEPAHLDRCRRILAIPGQAARAAADRLSDSRRNRCGARGARRRDVDRPTGSGTLAARDPNRTASVRAHSAAMRGHRAGDGCASPVRRQRPEATVHPASSGRAACITAWLRERNGQPGDPAFRHARGTRSAAMPSNASSRAMRRPRKRAAPHSDANG